MEFDDKVRQIALDLAIEFQKKHNNTETEKWIDSVISDAKSIQPKIANYLRERTNDPDRTFHMA